jgi:hypothetical protein
MNNAFEFRQKNDVKIDVDSISFVECMMIMYIQRHHIVLTLCVISTDQYVKSNFDGELGDI